MYIRWSGAGCLLYVFALLAVPAAVGVTRATTVITGSHDRPLHLIVLAGMLLLFGAVTFLIGSSLNANGLRHTVNDVPLEVGAGFFPFLSFVLVCWAVGSATSEWVGWAVFLLAIAGLFLWGRSRT